MRGSTNARYLYAWIWFSSGHWKWTTWANQEDQSGDSNLSVRCLRERERGSEWERESGTTTASGAAVATSTAVAAISVVTNTVGCRHHQLRTPCCASSLLPDADIGLPNRLDYWPPPQCHHCPANPRDNRRWGRIEAKAKSPYIFHVLISSKRKSYRCNGNQNRNFFNKEKVPIGAISH